MVGPRLGLGVMRNLNSIFPPSALLLDQISSRSNRFHRVFWGQLGPSRALKLKE